MRKIIIYRILIVVFIISIGLLINSFIKSYRADKLYAEARDIYYKNIEEVIEQELVEETEETQEQSEVSEDQPLEEPTEEEPSEENQQPEQNQQEEAEEVEPVDISEFNENVVGWINVENTNID